MSEPTFPAKLKLTWVEQVMRDREATFFDNTVAVAIASRVTDRSEATISPSTIANIIGAKGARSIVRSVMKIGVFGSLKGDLETVARSRQAFFHLPADHQNSAWPSRIKPLEMWLGESE